MNINLITILISIYFVSYVQSFGCNENIFCGSTFSKNTWFQEIDKLFGTCNTIYILNKFV